MKIFVTENFYVGLDLFLEPFVYTYPKRAIKFEEDLISKIENLVFFPYKFRKLNNSKNNSYRVMVFKGYKIIYDVNEDREEIIIVAFVGNDDRF